LSKIFRTGMASGASSQDADVITGSSRATIFSGSDIAPWRSRRTSVASQPVRNVIPPQTHGCTTPKVAKHETTVRSPRSSRIWTRTFVVVRMISTSPGPARMRECSGCSSSSPRILIGDRRSSAIANASKRTKKP
jgi:hypothetical protein